MRPFNEKLWGCIGALMVLAMIIIGCGAGNDLLDEAGGRYTFELELADGGQSDVHQIDIFRITDCDNDGTADDPEDPLTDVIGLVTVNVSTDAPGVSLISYMVNYIPELSVNQNGVYQMPPDMLPKSGQFNSFDVDSGGSGSNSIIIMTHDQKRAVLTDLINNTPALSNALYSIDVELTLQDYEGNTFTQHVYKDVELFDVYRCSGGE